MPLSTEGATEDKAYAEPNGQDHYTKSKERGGRCGRPFEPLGTQAPVELTVYFRNRGLPS